MSKGFDPYYKWLGIAPAEQPPNHYRLLGINLFEADPDVIQAAADQRMAHLKGMRLGKHVELSERLLNEVAAARACLLNPRSKETYDLQLATEIESSRPLAELPDEAVRLPQSTGSFPTGRGGPVRPIVPIHREPNRSNSLSRHWFMNLVILGIVLAVGYAGYRFFTWQPPGRLSIVVENAPRGAVVLVDGERVENLAKALILTPGPHEVIIRGPDETVLLRQTAVVEPGEPRTIYLRLDPRLRAN